MKCTTFAHIFSLDFRVYGPSVSTNQCTRVLTSTCQSICGQQNSEAMVAIDMPAGPSEVLVIADKLASPVHVAADLLSQVATFFLSVFVSLAC